MARDMTHECILFAGASGFTGTAGATGQTGATGMCKCISLIKLCALTSLGDMCTVFANRSGADCSPIGVSSLPKVSHNSNLETAHIAYM